MGFRWLKRPVLCNYYVTYRCNAACSFCDIWERPSPYVSMENVRRNLHDLKKLGVKIIDFTGGEPLLHKELPTFCRMAKEMGFQTTVTTNTLLYPKFAKDLRGIVDLLHFSLDAATPEAHNQSRGVACFDFVMKSIQLAKDLGEFPDILFTVTRHNFDQLEPIYKKISLPNNLILIVNPVFAYNDLVDQGGEKLSMGFTTQQLNELSEWGRKKYIFLNDAFLALRRDGGNRTNDPVCRAASSCIVISPENKLLLPCYHLGIETFSIDNNLFQLWRSEKIQQLIRHEGRYAACEGCVINCYMQPSFSVEINRYFWKALPSTLKYLYEKKILRLR